MEKMDLVADDVLYNGKIVTLDSDFSIAEAVAIKGEKFLAVGDNEEILDLVGNDTNEVDLKGKTVIPGLIDSHVHLTLAASDLLLPSIEGSTSISDIVDVLREEAEKRSSGEWIVVRKTTLSQISSDLKEDRFPNRWDLDPATPNNPVCIASGHWVIVNSYALKKLNITKDTPQLEGGEIVMDPKTGEPTGLFKEASAMSLVTDHLPEISYEEKVKGILSACKKFNEWGITSIYNLSASKEDLRALQEIWLRDKLTLRIYNSFAIDYPKVHSLEDDLAMIHDLGSFASYLGFGNKMLKIGAIGEIIFNGIMPRSKLKQISIEAANYNLRVGVHAHHPKGDAIDDLLDLWEEVNEEVDITDKRFFVIHGTFPCKENFEKIKTMNLVVSCQPVFLYVMYDFIKDIFPQRTPMPLRDWLDNGINIGLGTDYPFGGGYENPGANPMYVMYNAVTRKTKEGRVGDPDQVITREEALKCYTIYNAYITFEENLKGSIEPDKLADLVVLDKDILTCPEDEIKNIKPAMTMVGGKTVYKRR